MDKLKSLGSKMTFNSTPGGKLSKAFRFDKDLNVLKRSNDPFTDGPTLEDPSLPKSHLYIHCACLFLTFLAICTMGGAMGFQGKWVGVSGGSGFTIFLLITSFLLSAFLLITPIVYDRWDRMRKPAKFLHVARSTLILHAFGTLLMLLAAMITTISAWTAPGCKNPDNDPNAAKGDEFKQGLKNFCDTKKASGIFDWLSLICWIALLILVGLVFNRERKASRRREPGFTPPETSGGISYANVYTGHEEERYDSEPKPSDDVSGAAPAAYDPPVTSSYGYGNQPAQVQVQEHRASIDAYGSAGDRTSRTMQLAYSDPYAAIRANLASDPYTFSASQHPVTYAQQPQPDVHYQQPEPYPQPPATYGMPNPPQYGGYR